MNDWITVQTFVYPHEAHIAKAILDAEGIDSMIRDELTVQVYNFISNAIGGVKLQVKVGRESHAYQILVDAGIIIPEIKSDTNVLGRIDSLTAGIPIIGMAEPLIRIFILAGLTTLIVLLIVFLAMRPSTSERLMEHSWCVTEFSYREVIYQPNTVSCIKGLGCNENVYFNADGKVRFPGFNSKSVSAKWSLQGYLLTISNADTLQHIYEGTYEVDVFFNKIQMKSDATTITGKYWSYFTF